MSRIQCTIGTFADCNAINSDGSVGAAVAGGSDFSGYALIPGVLQAYKASAQDLAGLAAAGRIRASPHHRRAFVAEPFAAELATPASQAFSGVSRPAWIEFARATHHP